MNTGAKNIYRIKRNDWTPLLSFGGVQTRTTATGWHSYPYNAPYVRTMGVRWKNSSGTILNNDIGFRRNLGGTYADYNTSSGDTFEIKFDHSKLTAIWYRYSHVNGILQPLTEMPELRILSFRGSAINFGNMDLSQCSKFSHLEISNADGLSNSITSITFHPNAPLKFAYLNNSYPQAVKDTVLTQAYNQRDVADISGMTEQRKLIDIAGYSTSLQYMVDELVNNYGWSIT